ncbi:MAG: hypothetical protein FJ240_02880 [Nitrospira sp.]|nr:hypothetical protein [Nitrospira sp.]
MKNRFFYHILTACLLFIMAGTAWAENVSVTIPDYDILNASIMRPDRETRLKWLKDFETAPKARIESGIRTQLLQARSLGFGTSMSLLSHLDYIPGERNQGSCGNCWVWAATGILEIAHSVQDNVKDRLSIQFLNSCKTDRYACCGGNLSWYTSWYAGQERAVPWSNTNASYFDGSRGCSSQPAVTCGSISTSPDYPITSIQQQVIATTGSITQDTAINNIKNILNQNKAVWFGFYLANQTDWNAFFNFWGAQTENAVWNPDPYCGRTWDDYSGGGHAVLIVGYNDEVAEPYWIVLNSWGTSGGGRPNGLFRMRMQMNYNCTLSDPPFGSFYSREFATINVNFGSSQPPSPFGASGWVTTSSGTGISGVTMTFTRLSGTGAIPASVQTDADGRWSQIGFQPGTSYRVTPTKSGSTFSPVYRNFSSASSVLNFTGTASSTGFNASGRAATNTGTGISGVTMTFSIYYGRGAIPASVQTDASGNWSQTGFQSGTTYRVTPTKSGSTFSPVNRIFSNTSAALNFTGTVPASPFSGAGTVTDGSTGISGVTMTFSRVSGTGTIPASVQTNADGSWSQTGFQSGTTYRVTPGKTGYTFSPASLSFSGTSTTLNFTGTVSTGDFSVSGKAATRTVTAISGVTMTFTRISGTGAIPASVQTDAGGNWTQTGFQSGTTYRVTPGKTGKIFYPSSISFSSSSTSLNFYSYN